MSSFFLGQPLDIIIYKIISFHYYLKEQQEIGVNHSVVSPIPQLCLYDFPSEITRELVSVYNLQKEPIEYLKDYWYDVRLMDLNIA